MVNSVLDSGRKSISIPDTFVNNGKVLSGAVDISEGFNTFFSSIGPKLAKNISQTPQKKFSDYLLSVCLYPIFLWDLVCL